MSARKRHTARRIALTPQERRELWRMTVGQDLYNLAIATVAMLTVALIAWGGK
jgi:hypothetical protein